MPKKNTKAQRSNELDGPEFFAAIDLIEKVPWAILESSVAAPDTTTVEGVRSAVSAQ